MSGLIPVDGDIALAAAGAAIIGAVAIAPSIERREGVKLWIAISISYRSLLVRAGWGASTFPSARYCVITVSMGSQETVLSRKRGPKPTGKGQLIGVRLQPDQLASLDAWIERQPDKPTRPEAVRAILREKLP
jgi:hypothetical protein